MMKSVRASLQLSISTIVLLILALALMVIVIGSFTGLFSASEEKLLNSILLMDASEKATSDNLIAGAHAYRMQRNRDQIFTMSFYNAGHEECVESAHVIFNCGNPAETITFSTHASLDMSVPMGEERTLGGVTRVASFVHKRDYVCVMKVRCGSEKIVMAEQHTILKIT